MATLRGYRLTTCDRKPMDPLVEKQELTALTYDDETFAGIISSDTLEHVEQMADAIQELHRVTKPGGFLLAGVPVGDREVTARCPEDHPDRKWNHIWLPGRDLLDIALKPYYRHIGTVESFAGSRMRLSVIWILEKR